MQHPLRQLLPFSRTQILGQLGRKIRTRESQSWTTPRSSN